jgi:hypothetical protein
MPSREARALAFDVAGRLWIATPLGVVRRQEGGWSLRHSRRWLLSDDVRDVAIAPDGTAWAATAAGVSAISQETMTLEAKAHSYRNIIKTRHMRPPGLIGPAVLVTPGSLAQSWVSDTDNDGQHTSLLCAAESFRYAVTKAPDAKANAQEAFRALEALQKVTGTNHFIARSMIPRNAEPQNDVNRLYSPQERAEIRRDDPRYKFVEERWLPSQDNQWLWKRDTSSDEISGHLFAYALFYDLVADAEEKKQVAQLVERVVGGLVDNGFVLKDIDGEATRWGVWSPERLNHDANWREERGNNSIAMLSYLRVASHVTGNPRFAKATAELIEKHGYAQNALMADYGIPSERTHITDTLLSLDYTGLMGYEANQRLRRTYQRGMQQWYKSVQNDGIPLYDFVYSRFSGRRVSLAKAAETLRDWPLDLIEWTVDNRFREDVERDTTPGTGEGFLTRILPRSEMGLTPWDQEPYKAVIGASGHWEEKNTSWPLAYWMGRYFGFILPPK